MVWCGLATRTATKGKPIAMHPMRCVERIVPSNVAAMALRIAMKHATTAIKPIPTPAPTRVLMLGVVMVLFKATKNVTTQTMSMMMPVPMGVPQMCVAITELMLVRSAMVLQAVTKIVIC